MSPRYDKEWTADLLNGDLRLGSTSPEEFLLQSGLTQGMTAVDYGCGPGFFTVAAANIVGAEGQVYAADIEPTMVALVAGRAADLGLDNVKAVLNEGMEAPLPDAVADFGICALVLHYYERREERVSLARELKRLIKRGGHVLVLQWVPGDADSDSTSLRQNKRISFEETAAIMAEAGLECDGPYPVGSRYYKVIAKSPGA